MRNPPNKVLQLTTAEVSTDTYRCWYLATGTDQPETDLAETQAGNGRPKPGSQKPETETGNRKLKIGNATNLVSLLTARVLFGASVYFSSTYLTTLLAGDFETPNFSMFSGAPKQISLKFKSLSSYISQISQYHS